MTNIIKFAIFLIILLDFNVVLYNFYILTKVQHNVKQIPKNNVTGIACEYLELGKLIPINWALIITNILFVVLK